MASHAFDEVAAADEGWTASDFSDVQDASDLSDEQWDALNAYTDEETQAAGEQWLEQQAKMEVEERAIARAVGQGFVFLPAEVLEGGSAPVDPWESSDRPPLPGEPGYGEESRPSPQRIALQRQVSNLARAYRREGKPPCEVHPDPVRPGHDRIRLVPELRREAFRLRCELLVPPPLHRVAAILRVARRAREHRPRPVRAGGGSRDRPRQSDDDEDADPHSVAEVAA
jgi:hypothetical protein